MNTEPDAFAVLVIDRLFLIKLFYSNSTLGPLSRFVPFAHNSKIQKLKGGIAVAKPLPVVLSSAIWFCFQSMPTLWESPRLKRRWRSLSSSTPLDPFSQRFLSDGSPSAVQYDIVQAHGPWHTLGSRCLEWFPPAPFPFAEHWDSAALNMESLSENRSEGNPSKWLADLSPLPPSTLILTALHPLECWGARCICSRPVEVDDSGDLLLAVWAIQISNNELDVKRNRVSVRQLVSNEWKLEILSPFLATFLLDWVCAPHLDKYPLHMYHSHVELDTFQTNPLLS